MGNVWHAMTRQEAEPLESRASDRATLTAADSGPGPVVPDIAPPAASPARGNHYSSLLVAHHDPDGKVTEQYRVLRAHLLARYRSGRFCLMITSAEAGEGKTVTCLNLAVTLAGRSEFRTVVVDCDFRKRRAASLLRARNSPGLAEVLRGLAGPQEALHPTLYPNLFFIPAGTTSGESGGELLNRPELDDMVRQLRRQYDCVLFDTPPLNVLSDAACLGRVVEEALLVVRMNKTRRESIDKAVQTLRAVNVRTAGMVLTHQERFLPGYIYRCS